MSESYKVPQEVRREAERGLELREKYGRGGLSTREAGEAGVGSGVARAVDLMEGSVTFETIKRMVAFFNRHEVYKKEGHHKKDPPSNSLISWLLWGGDAGREWAESIVEKEAEKGLTFMGLIKASRVDTDKDGRSHPKKYFEGLDEATKRAREREIERRQSEGVKPPKLYEDLPGDDQDTTPSKYSKTDVAEKIREEIEGTGKDEFLRASAKVSGISISILEEVYDRGLKAWAVSGHRPGATAQAWARARIYSFISGGKTQKTADKDLWERHKESRK